ncbi:MAG: aminomethyl-transferring glycine dehydrogenase subunit GcvPA [Candidatus Thermoplasmatota archaeon]|nr:aminomethyl-transferring glycine dehydrogenase subunit GcvPA [Candidatus Thermoplasmatota archaeon]MEE3083208.1 aminomethyl-transferring glycine dehydrogenase subunit GcvPA [Candidatus Thermoplasmatota archaeon]
MVDQLPNLGRENEMLNAMGMESIDALFADIPEHVLRTTPLDLPDPQSEEEILREAQMLLSANVSLNSRPSFLGAGLYSNYVPSMVPMLATRGEFLTAYTPYQPEVSQGMLQAMWEFQTMVSELVALPVSNVSMYDASTAAAEAITCAVRVHERKAEQKSTVYVSALVPPHRLSVIHNYTQGAGISVKLIPHDEDGLLNLDAANQAAGACAIYVEQPNAFGLLDEGLLQLKEIVGENTALIVGVQPVSLGLVSPPGEYGADIVVGEGQPFGIGPTAGGPIYGLFACTNAYLRQMPGRIVGQSIDADGLKAFTLTLSTREQHIRRHRATSNICSNETLIALMGAMHMAMLGPVGLQTLAQRNTAACEATKQALSSIEGIDLVHPSGVHFNEFAIKLPGEAASLLDFLDSECDLTGGFDLSDWWPELGDSLLVCATDQIDMEDIEELADGIRDWISEVVE